MRLDNHVAVRIPKGAALVLQVHLVTSGKEETCRIAVGLQYAREVVHRQLRHVLLMDTKYSIPPGAALHPVRVTRELAQDAVGVGLFCHMHVRGRAMTFKAHYPDGKSETLLVIPNYSFDWQHPYQWGPDQKRFPKGTRIECVAHYDNSPFNPYNPDPKATVKDGPQTFHEMMNGFFFYTAAGERLNLEIDPKTGAAKDSKEARKAGIDE
jgi:hypothetical protein